MSANSRRFMTPLLAWRCAITTPRALRRNDKARELKLLAEKKLGQWLIDAEKEGIWYMGRPSKGVKIGTPPGPRRHYAQEIGH